jgi:predicted kinase
VAKPVLARALSQRNLATKHSAILIFEDIWLMRLFGDQMKTFDDYKLNSQKLKSVIGPLVTDLLKSGQSVVMDFPANSKTSRAWFRSVFEQASAAHVLHFVNSSNQRCLQWIAQRNAE